MTLTCAIEVGRHVLKSSRQLVYLQLAKSRNLCFYGLGDSSCAVQMTCGELTRFDVPSEPGDGV